jgi:rhodanese-related sulfurtransferase
MDINVTELKQRLDAGEKFIFLDVREPHEFDEFNLGAMLIPLANVPEHIANFDDHKDDEIVIHCRSGKRSGMAQMMFQQAGFTNVRNVEGGVLDWIEKFGNK